MKAFFRRLGLAVIIICLAYALIYFISYPRYTYRGTAPNMGFDRYYAMKLAESAKLGVRPGNQEKLVRFSPGRTKLAILYIHGWSASRAEGEEVMDRVAAKLKANIYYLRLPGHGATKEDFAAVTYRDYIDQAEEAFAMMPLLGERVVVAGSSMGGLLGTYLAAEYPGRVAALVLASPFYDFASPSTKLFYYPGGTTLVELLQGKVRRPTADPTHSSEWEKYWTVEKYYSSFKSAADMVKRAARESVYRKITDPVLMLYYYDDEKNQDTSASVAAMKRAFDLFGKDAKPNPLNRAVAIPKAAHVMLSKWVESDRARAEKEIVEFLLRIE